MLRHTTLAQRRTLKLDGLATRWAWKGVNRCTECTLRTINRLTNNLGLTLRQALF